MVMSQKNRNSFYVLDRVITMPYVPYDKTTVIDMKVSIKSGGIVLLKIISYASSIDSIVGRRVIVESRLN